ncbi:hypothetical protein M407DRAFT_30002 [Tulasnella calospora MUT 4182]|uniref:F-box domain-containing protein n=1 Tax=Tulasnella calospora MUT 4182 TaxID=1051891 RepID=A0A0C3Q941_9AGAM|nr:hypothetical protein M407DRAFT_30002 [Tulasnella calospora MUT 4182]
MTMHPQELGDDQRINDYLKLELEFTNQFASKIVLAHKTWREYNKWERPVKFFLGAFFAALTEWKAMTSPTPQEETLEEDLEVGIDDPTDSAYGPDCWTPTSLYQWAYFTLKLESFDLEDADELRDTLVVRMYRTQQYDAELFGSGYQNAYPLAEDLVSRSSSPALDDRRGARPALIHQLPPEILSEVFVQAHDGVLYFPILVSHVDSRFRTIAKSTAFLWTTIDVNLPLSLVSLYLKHSSTALLDIRIDLQGGGRRQNAASRLGPFLAVVAEHRERVASLSMSAFKPGAVDEMVKALMMGPGSTYPQLRRLDTGCRLWAPRYPRVLEPLDCQVLAPPRLQDLCLRGLRSRNWVSAFSEPMAGLKLLCLANNTKLFLSDLLIVLTKTPNLETLVIQDCIIEQDPLAGPLAVTLPNLTTLQYVTLPDSSVAINSIQQRLLTPKLTSLKAWWDCNFFRYVDHTPTLIPMLWANPQLERLDLCNCTVRQQTWREAFSATGSLKYLRLRSSELESDDLEALSEMGVGEDGEQRLLPHLEHLVLENVYSLSTGDIKRIVMHRPSLQCLELRGWDGSNVADDDVQFLRQSVECFVLETFYKESGALGEEDEDEENEEWSSTGTPSEGSWLSGDEEVVSGHLAVTNSANNFQLILPGLLAILPKLPNLETLVTQDYTIFGDPLKPTSTVILPNLMALRCGTINDKSIDLVQQVLLTPKLDSLRV